MPTLGGLRSIASCNSTLASNDSEIFAELKQGFPLTILGSFKCQMIKAIFFIDLFQRNLSLISIGTFVIADEGPHTLHEFVCV